MLRRRVSATATLGTRQALSGRHHEAATADTYATAGRSRWLDGNSDDLDTFGGPQVNLRGCPLQGLRPVDLSTAYASINSAVAPVVYAYGALPLTDIVVAMAEGGLLAGAPPKVIARWLQDPVSMSSGKIRSFNELMGPNRASAFEAMLRWLFDEYETTCSPLRRYFVQRPDLDAKVWVPFLRGTVWAYHDSKLASRLLDLTTPIVNKAPGLEPLFLSGSRGSPRSPPAARAALPYRG
jgi:hypothetical protein